MTDFHEMKDNATEQSDRPQSITRPEAEKLVRSVMSKHLGEKMPANLFKDSVDQLMEEINGAEFH